MLPDKIGSIELLRALIGRIPDGHGKEIASLFEIFLNQSRSGISNSVSTIPLSTLQGKIKKETPSNSNIEGMREKIATGNPAGLRSINTASITPGKITQIYQDNIPRSIPLLANQASKKYGVPQDIFRKMIWIESEFNPVAKSSRGAMGLGQLMPDTALELGLRVDSDKSVGSVWHPESNLNASARYMKWLHNQFLSKGVEANEAWRFSAAAYNAGIGNISRAMKKVTHGNQFRWEDVALQLPEVTGKAAKETLNYISRLKFNA